MPLARLKRLAVAAAAGLIMIAVAPAAVADPDPSADPAAAMLTGVLVSAGVVFATGAVEATPRYALAPGGIIIGNPMTVAALAGRRFHETVDDHWPEVEGWLALGATMRQATLSPARFAVHAAMIPSTDQTKTTGLVTLPGAFVGAIFGGLSPVEAGRFQVVVRVLWST